MPNYSHITLLAGSIRLLFEIHSVEWLFDNWLAIWKDRFDFHSSENRAEQSRASRKAFSGKESALLAMSHWVCLKVVTREGNTRTHWRRHNIQRNQSGLQRLPLWGCLCLLLLFLCGHPTWSPWSSSGLPLGNTSTSLETRWRLLSADWLGSAEVCTSSATLAGGCSRTGSSW